VSQAGLLVVALALDAAFGEPPALWSRLPHPAVLLGRLIGRADRRFNTGQRRRIKGAAVIAALAGAAAAAGAGLAALPGSGVVEVAVAAILLAQRSLSDHVAAVATALDRSLEDGRRSVAMIVGRDTAAMDAPAVARAAIESAAENLSDGVVAPAFWFLVAGLPGMLAYKAINTADSMVGYRTPRHRAFGWAAARLDDAANWVPARLTALLIVASFLRPGILPAVARDARQHRSPNAGWPESAMARCLDVALAGPRSYDGAMRAFPYVHEAGNRQPGRAEIDRAVRAIWRVWALGLCLTGALAIA